MPPELEWILHLLPAPTRFAAVAGGTAVIAFGSLVSFFKLSVSALEAAAKIPDAAIEALGAWRGFLNRVRAALAPLESVPLASEVERRSGRDRRDGIERRRTVMAVVPERRSGIDRRQGERRGSDEAPLGFTEKH